jgi:NhaP-type Na+/H+ or K+/H+ antiporter
MKDLTLSVVGVLTLALGIGLVFHWLYPLVELSSELAGLFVFVAVVLKLVLSRLWSLRHKARARADAEAGK